MSDIKKLVNSIVNYVKKKTLPKVITSWFLEKP